MLLMWTGGADSTFLLWALLASGYKVRTLCVRHGQLGHDEQQAVARCAVAWRLGELGLPAWDHTDVRLDYAGADMSVLGGGLPQPAMWLGLGVPHLRRNEHLVLGWHRGDDVWQSRASIESAHAALSQLMQMDDRKGRLLAPLEGIYKQQIVAALDELDLGDIIWTCENPIPGHTAPCGRCLPCASLAMARAWRTGAPQWDQWDGASAESLRETAMGEMRDQIRMSGGASTGLLRSEVSARLIETVAELARTKETTP